MMDNKEIQEYLERAIQGIIETYELFGAILNRHASREEVEQYLEYFGLDADDFDIHAGDLAGMESEDQDDMESATDAVCGALEESVLETMHDYPLSVDDSHIWFTLGGPNISANVTGWSVNGGAGGHMWVDVQDITLKGRWGGTSVDVELYDSLATSFACNAIAELFEQNLLLKFGQL